ncbi:AAA domain-containing protein [Telluribacter humicola]|uniref:AAA domain-containing protein n=1 Tax=Telluribacter humicola TaxID=1720261 RepID=UPI001A95CF4E|nr:AAA domain-containing protein [Telluribacter humicola]
MNKILKAYLKRLTNLSSRNKSLLLTRLPGEQFVDLHEGDFLLGKYSFELVRQLIQRKARIPLCDVQDPRYDRVNELSRKLRKITRTERFIEEERGARDLYVGYPFIRGKLSDGSVIHAPLLFFPVTLRMDREQWCLFGRDDAEVTLNRSFALAYAYFNETTIPDEVVEKSFDDFPTDALEFRTQLYEWLKTTPFRINFNQQLFEDKIQPFEVLKSSDLQTLEKTGELKLYAEAVLGIFPQAGSYLVPDYDVLLEVGEDDPGFNLLSPYADESIQKEPPATILREEQVLTPFQTDVSQEKVIRAVKKGESVVVQGPPGTGKSQLICNLMADFAAQGKRVLLICQKRAALDVVYQRLQSVGLAPFAALIHDFRNDRPELYRQLANQIEQVDAYRNQNYSLDAVVLERQFTQESRQIDRVVEELESFRSALFDELECGVSIKELYLSSNPAAPHISLTDVEGKQLYRLFRLDSVEDFRRRLRLYAAYAQRIGPEHGWYQRRSFADYSISELRRMEQLLHDWPLFMQRQREQFEAVTGAPFAAEFIEDRDEVLERLSDVRELLQDDTIFKLFQGYLRDTDQSIRRLALVRQIVATLEGWEGMEATLPATDLTPFRGQLMKAVSARQSWTSSQWWEWFGSDKDVIRRVAASNGLSTRLEDLERLSLLLRNRLQMEEWLQNPLVHFEVDYLDRVLPNEEQYTLFFQKSEKASDAVVRLRIKQWSQVLHTLALNASSRSTFIEAIDALIQWVEAWEGSVHALSPFLLPEQIKRLIETPQWASQLRDQLQADFDSLVEMDRLWQQMALHEQAVTTQVLKKSQETASTQPEAVVALFDNSLRLAWIEYIETRFPDLRAVSSLRMQQWEEQLQGSIRSKQSLSRDIVLIKLREETYQDVENNRLGNRVTYRELYHQVTKKRKIWPIRKLLEEHSEEVFRLVPCWMASPESVSAMFPMQKDLFDLVIFDEASQCYAEYGLPAAYRGRQIVVTGDSKQLPPSDLYRVRFEEGAEEEDVPVALEVDSLLDLAAQTLLKYQLAGHYRSRSLDLIDFSNQHFYKNTLRLLPDFRHVNDAEPGIKYLKVEGVWEKNTNIAEADRVVQLLKNLSTTGQSVGVVTFNFHQQQLIQELIEQENVALPELFVKNIENVQGDERDVIIFSVGYAPDMRGRLVMQFGSLNTQGGENRLNVAITRARERVYIVTSLWPSQLQVEQTANEGPKLLKAYLQYALDVSEGNYRPQPLPTKTYRTDWLLKDKLAHKEQGLVKELPFADLTIRSGGTYQGLILTDDDLYHQSASSKEPHAYLPMILQQKNWPYSRVYSREYWRSERGVEVK